MSATLKTDSMRNQKTNGLLILALASLALIALGFWLIQVWKVSDGAQILEGHVVGYTCRSFNCKVQVQIKEPTGQSLTFSGRRLPHRPFREGDTVPVVYNVLSHEVVIDTYEQRWSQPVLYFMLALLFWSLCLMGCIQLLKRTKS